MKKKIPFDHAATGDELKAMRNRLSRILVEQIVPAYGNTTKPARRIERAIAALDALRSELDARLCAEGWDYDNVYFGECSPDQSLRPRSLVEIGR